MRIRVVGIVAGDLVHLELRGGAIDDATEPQQLAVRVGEELEIKVGFFPVVDRTIQGRLEAVQLIQQLERQRLKGPGE